MMGRKGFALVLTLVITALMVAVTAELIHQVYVDTSLSRGFRDGQQASLLAESGIEGGKKLLQMALSGQGYSSLSDKWAQPFKLDDETGSITITAVEESGKICLNDLAQNTVTHETLKRLGKQLELPDDIWIALSDWIDTNDETQSGGAESTYYMTLKSPYRARNGKLATLSELSLVKGFTPTVIEKLKNYVTVYSEYGTSTIGTAKININTAPIKVLIALHSQINNDLANKLDFERKLKPFSSVGELSRIQGFDKISQDLVTSCSVKGAVYRITSVARVKDTSRTVEAVINQNDGTVFSWQEY